MAELTARQREQKETEKRILETARLASFVFPPGKIEFFEEPDLSIETPNGRLYVEITQLNRPADESGFPPVQTESFHQQVVRLAEAQYGELDGVPVTVHVHFLDEQRCATQDAKRWRELTERGDKRKKMAESLARFVKDRFMPGVSTMNFERLAELPTGFSALAVWLRTDPWFSGEGGGLTALEREYLGQSIQKKNKLLSVYRKNAPNFPIWLLIASGSTIARGVPVPAGFEDWEFEFDFDKVLFFSGMDNKVWEIRRAETPRRECVSERTE
jgi:hypothetical protein